MSRGRIALTGIAIALVGAVALYRTTTREDAFDDASANALITRYCTDCHNPGEFAGSLRLDDKDVASIGHDAEVWERVVRKLKTGMMPPADAPRPDRETLTAFVHALENRLDREAVLNPVVARTAIRRLNRTEYANAIRDLLHLEVDASTLLPLDDSSEGFDNIATALGVSPSLIESYVSAAMKVSRSAIGDATAPRTQLTYNAPERLQQDSHLEGLPLGTRGGMRIEHHFPLDAEYEIRIRRGFRTPRTTRIDVTLDGAVVAAAQEAASFRIRVPAGPHTLTAALVDTVRPVGVDDIYEPVAAAGSIAGIDIDGPIAPTGTGDTPSRRRILICAPAADEKACAEDIVSTLATRAFRRPLRREELPPLMQFFDAGRAERDFESGIQQALARILVDPRFLYRIERTTPAGDLETSARIDDFELATRLSFFIWSSIPDDALLGLASEDRLHEPAVLDAQVRRMLSDAKAGALVDNFASQWLLLRELDSVTPDAEAFDENLRQSMLHETQALIATVMREDLNVTRLIDADFTFVDERLAAHYGIPGVHGSRFRRIEWPESHPRRGLLGHASVLTLTSVTSRTSPVIRGSWILESLLGSPVPTPPPNVETTLEGDDGAAVATTVRERLEAHRSNPVCASCHQIMDPLGFTLEQFDLIGAWRERDGEQPIDTSARLADGTQLDGPVDLRNALLERREAFVTGVAERLLTYALGRRIEYYDMPTVRAIVRAADADDDRFSAFVLGVARSAPFQTRAEEVQ
jgi:hypothetical protein